MPPPQLARCAAQTMMLHDECANRAILQQCFAFCLLRLLCILCLLAQAYLHLALTTTMKKHWHHLYAFSQHFARTATFQSIDFFDDFFLFFLTLESDDADNTKSQTKSKVGFIAYAYIAH
jgi:hypothetical protein